MYDPRAGLEMISRYSKENDPRVYIKRYLTRKERDDLDAIVSTLLQSPPIVMNTAHAHDHHPGFMRSLECAVDGVALIKCNCALTGFPRELNPLLTYLGEL
eukprot:PhF_6_TR12640/c0_g1_i5/m.20033